MTFPESKTQNENPSNGFRKMKTHQMGSNARLHIYSAMHTIIHIYYSCNGFTHAMQLLLQCYHSCNVITHEMTLFMHYYYSCNDITRAIHNVITPEAHGV